MLHYLPIVQTIDANKDYTVDVLRLDLIHPEISGNKWFKLKHNVSKALEQKHNTIITFGGAYSNHIAATASYCKLIGIRCIGIIRGEDSSVNNTTLMYAKQQGMELHFVNRDFYKQKNDLVMSEYLLSNFGKYYLIPEGGNNSEGVLGCKDILTQLSNNTYNYILCACGTGTTFAGLLLASYKQQIIVGINVLKGENTMPSDVVQQLNKIASNDKFVVQGNEAIHSSEISTHCILNQYSFSGYAGFDEKLIAFKKQFEQQFPIPLDYIYTNKLFFAAFDLMSRQKFKPQSKILIIHSGGLQGNIGFENRYASRFK